MAYPRVLVLDNHVFTRGVLVKALQGLGITGVLQASNHVEAMVLLTRLGSVDIVFCDLDRAGLECVEFLNCANQLGLARSVALSLDMQSNLERVVEKMTYFSGLTMLGVLKKPVQLNNLKKIMHRFKAIAFPLDQNLPSTTSLPSENDIRRGLNAGEFRAWYQPKLDMRDFSDAGAEVLVRWDHPVKGLLQPSDFLAAMLAYDLIDEMFKQLLEQGLEMLQALRSQGISQELAFKLHASQLSSRDLSMHIEQALYRYGLPGSVLTFEVLENGLLDAPLQTKESLVRLRLIGCGLSIDDFGADFSSLTLLFELPFTQIKLHGECMQNLAKPQNRALVTFAQALVSTMNLTLVIKGVSSSQIRDALVSMGCSYGQGFYLAGPMECQRFINWTKASVSNF